MSRLEQDRSGKRSAKAGGAGLAGYIRQVAKNLAGKCRCGDCSILRCDGTISTTDLNQKENNLVWNYRISS